MNAKIKLQCSEGHELFEKGITLATLYKSYGVRLDDSQKVLDGYDWDKAYEKMCRLAPGGDIDRKSFEKGKSKDLDLCPTYKVTSGQMKLLPKCKLCQ